MKEEEEFPHFKLKVPSTLKEETVTPAKMIDTTISSIEV